MATNTNYTDTNDKPHRLMDSLSYMIGKDGTNMASTTNPVPVDAIVTVDSMNVEAEMKTVSGHDLYKITGTITVTGNLAVSFGAVTGLTLQDIQSFEDKTKSWVYNTKGATVSTTAISLVAGNQNTDYPNLTNGDAIEIVYRGTSRITDKTGMTNITDGTDEATVNAGFSETETEAEKGLFVSGVTYGLDTEAAAGSQVRAVQVAVDNAGISATPNILVGGGIYKDSLDTYGDNDAVPLHFTANGKLLTDAEITFNDYTDDSNEFTVATSKMLAIGGIATSDVVDSGDVGALRMTVNRNLGVDVSEQSLTAMKVSATAAANLVTNPIFAELTDGTTAATVTTGTIKALNVAVSDGVTVPTVSTGTIKGLNVVLSNGTTAVAVDTAGTLTVKAAGSINTADKGIVGTPLVLTPASGTKQAFDFIINAPLASDNATLVILRDAVTIFNGYMGNRDGDGAIRFPAGDTAATTTWTVTVTGGSGDVFACVRHN